MDVGTVTDPRLSIDNLPHEFGTMIRRSEVDCPANVRLVASHEPVSHHDCGTRIRKECAAGALNSSRVCMDCGNGSEADIDCRMAARRVER